MALMRTRIVVGPAAFAAGLQLNLGRALAQASPLQVVMDGRSEAKTSNMTEAGIKGLAESAGNILLYAAGFIGVALVLMALLTLYQAHGDDDQQRARRGWVMLIVGSLATIPAIVAALVPYAMGI